MAGARVQRRGSARVGFGLERGSRPDLNRWLGFLVFFDDCESGSVASLDADGTARVRAGRGCGLAFGRGGPSGVRR